MSVHRPRLKILRRLGVALPGLTRKSADRRPHPPGAHGATGSRRRPSEYRRRLEEKQKVRFNYGVTERQLRRYFERGSAEAGRPGENMLALLERRLDNVVFRLGIAATIPAARQLVSHGHVMVDGKVVDRPGASLRAGQRISLTAAAAKRLANDAEPSGKLPSYLTRDPSDPWAGQVTGAPVRSDVPFPLDEALIVEFYAR